MTNLLILTGAAALAALVFVMLAFNHRAELDRRRLIRRSGETLTQVHDRFVALRRRNGKS